MDIGDTVRLDPTLFDDPPRQRGTGGKDYAKEKARRKANRPQHLAAFKLCVISMGDRFAETVVLSHPAFTHCKTRYKVNTLVGTVMSFLPAVLVPTA